MHRGVSGRILNTRRKVYKFFYSRVGVVHFSEFRHYFDGFHYSFLVLQKFCYRIGFRRSKFKHSGNVFDRHFCFHRSECDYLCNTFRTVFFNAVINYFLTSFNAEIDVEIGHRNTFGVQKTLKKEIIFQRFDVCNIYAVRNHTACARTSSRSNGDSDAFCVTNVVAYDKEVIDEAHFMNNAEFVFKTFVKFFCSCGIFSVIALVCEFFEKLKVVHIVGRDKVRQMINLVVGIVKILKRHIAHFCDFNGVVARLGNVLEKISHFLFGF